MTSRRFKTTNIQDVLRQFLREEGLETPLLEYRVEEAWAQVMGESIAKYTGEVRVQRGVLYVKIKSAPLRQNMQMMRQQIIQKLNTHVGAQVISDIKFN